jgi:hypothetical protein
MKRAPYDPKGIVSALIQAVPMLITHATITTGGTDSPSAGFAKPR